MRLVKSLHLKIMRTFSARIKKVKKLCKTRNFRVRATGLIKPSPAGTYNTYKDSLDNLEKNTACE